MTPRAVRQAERAAHLFWALALVLYAYGWMPTWGEPVVRWVVVPGIAGSGFAMWFAAPLRRLARRALARSMPRSRVGTVPFHSSKARPADGAIGQKRSAPS
jgi:hypothetical protein